MTRYTTTTVRRFSLSALFLLGMAMAATATAQSQEEVQPVVSGILTQLDLVEMKGVLNTDLGRPILFDITKPQLFEHLSLGSRVTIEMNGDGGADRVVGASMADVLEPPQPGP